MLAIEVKNLYKSFPTGFLNQNRKTVLNNVSFQVEMGKVTGFVGNNGSGKTTTIKTLFNFIIPDAGEIYFFGDVINQSCKKRIGYLPERPYLYDFLTLKKFLQFHWELANSDNSQLSNDRMMEVLKVVNLVEAVNVELRYFSKGMLQRAGIAQSLVHNPDLLIFDEPMSGLDPDGRLLVKDIIRDLKDQKKTVFFSSHLLQDMDELCDNLVIIQKGEVKYSGNLTGFKKEDHSLEEAFRHFLNDENQLKNKRG